MKIPSISPRLDFLNANPNVTLSGLFQWLAGRTSPVREALAIKGMKSRLLNFQNLFHSSDLNNDEADTIMTAPRVADGI